MTDAMSRYSGGWWPKRVSHKEIEKMKENMKKVPEIQLKSDIYHDQEIVEAEKILWKMPLTEDQQTTQNQTTQSQTRFKKYLLWLRQRFTSLF